MKKTIIIVYSLIIIVLPLMQYPMDPRSRYRDTNAILSKFQNDTYKFEPTSLSRFYSTEKIPVVSLKEKMSDNVIAQFQLPVNLKFIEYPRFSPDNKYLLILNATPSFLYTAHPEKYEWNLFDTTKQKNIKTFNREDHPIFRDRNSTLIEYDDGKIFHIPHIQKEEKLGFFSFFRNFWDAITSILSPSQSTPPSEPELKPTNAETQNKIPAAPQEEPVNVPISETTEIIPIQTTFLPITEEVVQIPQEPLLTEHTQQKEMLAPEEKMQSPTTTPSLSPLIAAAAKKVRESSSFSEEDDEESYGSSMEKNMLDFKKATKENRLEDMQDIMKKIFTELLEEDSERNEMLFQFEEYKDDNITKKEFILSFLQLYQEYLKTKPSEIEKIIKILFRLPEGIIGSPTTMQENALKNITATKTNDYSITIRDFTTRNQKTTSFTIARKIQTMLLNRSGNCLAVSLVEREKNTTTLLAEYALNIFIEQAPARYKQYNIGTANSPTVIGFLFMDDNTLLCLEKDWKIKVIDILEIQNKIK